MGDFGQARAQGAVIAGRDRVDGLAEQHDLAGEVAARLEQHRVEADVRREPAGGGLHGLSPADLAAPALADPPWPAFGLGWSLRSRPHTRSVSVRLPPAIGATATVSSPVSRDGTRLSRSSRRAEAVPKCAYFAER